MRQHYKPGIRLALDHKLSPSELKVLYLLLSSSLSSHRISWFIDMPHRTVQAALQSLKKKGLIKVNGETKHGKPIYAFNRTKYP